MVCICVAGCSKSNPGATGQTNAASGSGLQTEPSGPVTMKLKWEPGKKYDMEMTLQQTSRLTMPDAPKPVDQTMTMTQSFSMSALRATSDGGTELQLKFTAQKVKSTMGTQNVLDFDSSRPASEDGNNPAAPMFRKMVGAHLNYIMDANGKLVKVEGMQDFLNQLSGGDPQIGAMVKGMMNEGTIKQLVDRGQGLPDKPVKIGDTWPVGLPLNRGKLGTMNTKLDYTFKGWEQHDGHKCAVLDFTGTLPSEHAPESGQMQIKEGKITGKTWFATDIGMVMETTSDQDTALTVTVQEKTMNSQIQQTVTTKVANISDLPK